MTAIILVVIENGRMTEIRHPEELTAQNSLYFDLQRRQNVETGE